MKQCGFLNSLKGKFSRFAIHFFVALKLFVYFNLQLKLITSFLLVLNNFGSNLFYCWFVRQNARCAAEQTQTVTRQSSTITIAPIQGNYIYIYKSPKRMILAKK